VQWESYEAEGAHRDLLTLQTQFYEVQKVLHTTGAYLRQFLVDDKGCVLIACWGMPNLSYLDNAHRALSAAAQIRRKLLQMEMSCSFGITTGDVYCGTVGSALRMEYAAIGSVVNMSARLMCKAHGGILVDDATVQRLPNRAKHCLTELEPIKVKGRDEPLPVFSYVSAEAIEVQEKVVNDHAIPLAKREVMLRLLAAMLDKDSQPAPIPQRMNSMDDMNRCSPFRNPFTATRPRSGSVYSLRSATSYTPLQVLLIKGLDGSGKTSTVRWLRQKAVDRGIPVCCTKAAAADSQTDFVVWRRLFQALIPKDVFLSADVQRAYVHHLLHEVYPDANRSVRKTKFAVMRAVLGVTCSYTRPKLSRGISGALWFSKAGASDKADLAPPRSTSLEVVVSVISYLLNVTTTLLAIEHVENADEASLQVLCSLLKLQTRSAIVLTALKCVCADSTVGRLTKYRTQTVREDALHSTPWTKTYKAIVRGHRYTHTLFVEQYSSLDIEMMIAATLNVDKAPADITHLVLDYSGGTYFWVLEILQFIKEHGAERFLEAVSSGRTLSRSNTSAALLSSPPLSPVKEGHSARFSLCTPTSSMRGVGLTVSSLHEVQLDKLVLCRFENLSLDAQHVLRTASIIGPGFTAAVLHAVLPPRLGNCLGDCLQTLVDLHWVSPDINDASTYCFSHAHAHRLIYELTPSSERSITHRKIAEHIERTASPSSPVLAIQLCAHYQQCDPAKALQYAAKATDALVQVTMIFDFADCLELLGGAMSCCRSDEDVALLQALISQAQIAIVMFCMAAELDKRHATTAPHIARTRWYSAWFGVKESQVVPAACPVSRCHDHKHDHEGGRAGLREKFSHTKRGEAGDVVSELQSHNEASLKTDVDVDDADVQRVSETERTKRTFLQQLSQLNAVLSDKRGTFHPAD
jgi:hypothetical protein